MAQILQAEGRPRQDARKLPAVAVLTALGVVYGDIGTSPLYGLKQAVDAGGGPAPETVIGVVSLILWALILIGCPSSLAGLRSSPPRLCSIISVREDCFW